MLSLLENAKPFETVKSYFTPAKKSKFDTKTKVAISACCSGHVIPLNFYEDKCISWATDISITAHVIKQEITKLPIDKKVLKEFSGENVI